MSKPYYITTSDLLAKGKDDIPDELVSSANLIYSSPATLAFNSPGAKGFGVKRAGLAIPDSIMLLVAPGCCGRNTTGLEEAGGYASKFYYLMMDETDIVTGRHLNKIPQAVREVCDSLPKSPSVVMICITCVDALLGTDMDRVCKKASLEAKVPVLPCYMYALTREGRKPPMVHVRQTLYSLLEPMDKQLGSMNILGFFAPLINNCELYTLLHQAGIKQINEISTCKDFDEYKRMSSAIFNLILNPEARLAAQDMQKKLDIPCAELTRMYQVDKIKNQYQIFFDALGVTCDDKKYYEEALLSIANFTDKYPKTSISIGETLNANPFELALSLTRYGLIVKEIFASVSKEDFVYIRKLSALSPETKIYSNLSPTMLFYNCSTEYADITIGKDVEYYHPNTINVPWNEERQPFGYAGVIKLFKALKKEMDKSADKEN